MLKSKVNIDVYKSFSIENVYTCFIGAYFILNVLCNYNIFLYDGLYRILFVTDNTVEVEAGMTTQATCIILHVDFYQRVSIASYANRWYSQRRNVRPSVRLSHSGIVSKRRKLVS